MGNYKISVIVPIYNAQDTIRRSIDSVINQTIGFSNIELILYDDNSSDNTRAILKEYEDKYDNIVLLLSDESSCNAGKGRNEGIERSSADYIMFMDSDDEYCPSICETLYDEIISENADMVSCNYFNDDELSSKVMHNQARGMDSKNDKEIFLNEEIYDFKDVYVWSKIFRKSIITQNNVRFPEDATSEDIFFIFTLLIFVHKIVYLKNYVGYVKHSQYDSLSNSENYKETKRMMDSYFNIYSFYKDNNVSIDFSWLFTKCIEYYLDNIFISNVPPNKEEVNDLLNYVYDFEREIGFDDSYLNIVLKVPNRLIMKRQFGLAIGYFHFLGFIVRSKPLRNVYKLVNK